MNLPEVLPVLSQGSVFAITTEKTIALRAGAPWSMVLKASRYNISLNVGHIVPASWWAFTNHHNRIVSKKGPTPRLYLLCTIHKGAGFGESCFYPMNDEGVFDEKQPMDKSKVVRWLPPAEPFTATHMTLPLDGILSLTPLESDDFDVIAALTNDN
jgi:hypothetical protein